MLLTKMHKAFLFTNLFLHNLTKLYKTRHSYKTLHNCHETLQHYTKLYKHKHYNTLQDFYRTFQNFRRLYKTQRNSTQLYTTLHNSTQLYSKLCKNFHKIWQNYTKYKATHNFTKLCKTKTWQNLIKLYTTLHNFGNRNCTKCNNILFVFRTDTKLYTTLQNCTKLNVCSKKTIPNCLNKAVQNYINLYNTLHNSTTLYTSFQNSTKQIMF